MSRVSHPLSLPLVLFASLFAAGCAGHRGPDLTMTDGRVAAQLVQREFDAINRETVKVYHHIVAPDGRRLTKGEGGKFEHHRGLFVGWNKTSWNGHTYDFWHMGKGESQQFRGFAEPERIDLSPVAQVLQIDWVAPDGAIVLEELRGLQLVAQTDEQYTLLMRVRLRAPNGDVQLDGDPQHAGQQFRALQEFAEDAATPVRYLRPTFAKEHGNDVWTGCDWIGAVLPMSQQAVTVLRIEGNNNPGTTTWSTRPYGRFGATRTVMVTADKPLLIDQYYVIANGERDAAWCRTQSEFWRR